ncbi:MAG: lipid-A-disaccharide synthase [Rhodospirillaceae bacterium]
MSVYILALEPSGDVLGARLMQSLNATAEYKVSIFGVGGEAMGESGLDSLFDPSDLAILGIFEVIPKAGLVLRRVREVLLDIEKVQPDILVTIDSWGFTGRIHKALVKRRSLIKRVRYVAPQVWAWRPGRAKQLAAWIDHLLTLYPFEPPLFERHGLESTWVGHPVTESTFSGNAEDFRVAHALGNEIPVLTVLPGSRKSEVRALMPVFRETIQCLIQHMPSLTVVIPTITGVEHEVRVWSETLPVRSIVVTGSKARDDAFAVSRAALCASGTVTLELARAGVPHAIAYKVNPFSAFVFRCIAITRYVNLINILLQDRHIPEFLQERCTSTVLSKAILDLMNNESQRQQQRQAFASTMKKLSLMDNSPSDLAAQTILNLASR